MTNKVFATLLFTTPLLFTACNSTNETAPRADENIQVVQEATVKTSTPLSKTGSSSHVTYANDKKFIKSSGMLHIKSFMGTLQPTLMGMMESDPTHTTALGACSTLGQSMADDYNRVSDVKIRRTALRYRNPKNKPDATDVTVMERFLASHDFKEPLVVDMGDYYRVYKALAVKKACLACHGEHISQDLQKMLIQKYPNDMATNFKLGEFRGAVVAKVKK